MVKQAFALRDYEAAVEALRFTLRERPDQPRFHLLLGVAYHRLGAYEHTRAHLDQVRRSPRAGPRLSAHAEALPVRACR